MKRHTALVVLAALVSLAGPAAGDETTFCNFFITSVPRVITTQGHYCFDRNLSFAISSGDAITIDADFVVLDLNNFKLGGGSAGLGTFATGVAATSRSNITIRNGNIRGFRRGISIIGGNNILIENNALDGNTQFGLLAALTATVIVRNNVVTNTGGSTLGGYTYGIYALGDDTALIRDNVVSNVFSDLGGAIVGIRSNGGNTDHNLVKLGSSLTGNRVGTAWAYNRDNTVLGASSAYYAFWQSYALIGHNFSNP